MLSFFRRNRNSIHKEISAKVTTKENVVALLYDINCKDKYNIPKYIGGTNIVTTHGAIHYAQRGAGGNPGTAYNFTSAVFGTNANPNPTVDSEFNDLTYLTGSVKAFTSRSTNNIDPDNLILLIQQGDEKTVTWRFDWPATGLNWLTPITEGMITIASPTDGSLCLCHFEFDTPFTKTSDQILKLLVNHKFAGV